MGSGFDVCAHGAAADATRAIRKCAGFVDKRPVLHPHVTANGGPWSCMVRIRALSGPPDFDETGFPDGFVVGHEG